MHHAPQPAKVMFPVSTRMTTLDDNLVGKSLRIFRILPQSLPASQKAVEASPPGKIKDIYFIPFFAEITWGSRLNRRQVANVRCKNLTCSLHPPESQDKSKTSCNLRSRRLWYLERSGHVTPEYENLPCRRSVRYSKPLALYVPCAAFSPLVSRAK